MPPQAVRNPACPDFERLCRAADEHGWIVCISAGDFIERPSDQRPGRRTLGSIRLRRSAKDAPLIQVPINDDLALASRIALDQLLARANEPR